MPPFDTDITQNQGYRKKTMIIVAILQHFFLPHLICGDDIDYRTNGYKSQKNSILLIDFF